LQFQPHPLAACRVGHLDLKVITSPRKILFEKVRLKVIEARARFAPPAAQQEAPQQQIQQGKDEIVLGGDGTTSSRMT